VGGSSELSFVAPNFVTGLTGRQKPNGREFLKRRVAYSGQQVGVQQGQPLSAAMAGAAPSERDEAERYSLLIWILKQRWRDTCQLSTLTDSETLWHKIS
jgi:hypothetical protein